MLTCSLNLVSVGSIELFLNATQEAVNQFVFNVSAFIAENERIIDEIDDIIAGLADIHSRVNKVRKKFMCTRFSNFDELKHKQG